MCPKSTSSNAWQEYAQMRRETFQTELKKFKCKKKKQFALERKYKMSTTMRIRSCAGTGDAELEGELLRTPGGDAT